MTEKDWKEFIQMLEADREPKPYKMFIGKGFVQTIYDMYGKVGLASFLTDPNYDITLTGIDAAELARDLLK